jgi:hypothetical protein
MKNREPAFPFQSAPGMTLRDWFAGQAIVGLLANPNNTQSPEWAGFSWDAYKMADAMIAQRDKK